MINELVLFFDLYVGVVLVKLDYCWVYIFKFYMYVFIYDYMSKEYYEFFCFWNFDCYIFYFWVSGFIEFNDGCN